MTDQVERRVRNRVLATHRETIAEVCEAGRAVAASWSGTTASDGDQITDPLARELGEAGLRGPLLETLETAVDATAHRMAGNPVPAPPYLVVTSRGPTCRGTLDDGRRLVMLFELFEIDRRPRTYRFRDPSPDACLEVRVQR